MRPAANLVLIGMPGAGKSTCGVLLAKAAGLDFIDTDLRLQAVAGRRLQEILDQEGTGGFRRLEEQAVLSLDAAGCVIATGGSVVYSPAAMRHLAAGGRLFHLEVPLEELRARLANMASRGVVRTPGQSLEALYNERTPLYRRYAERSIDCAGLSHQQVVARLLAAAEEEPPGRRPAPRRP